MNLTDNQARLRDALPGTDQDGTTPAALAEATGLGYSTITRLLRELAELDTAVKDDTTGLWHTTAPAPAPDTDLPDRDQPPRPDENSTPQDNLADEPAQPDLAAEAPDPGTAPDTTTPPDGQTPVRMRKGALRDLVLAALRDADGQPLGPTELSRRLGGRSQGAIANACDALVANGHAVLTSERPRRFAATRTT